MGATKYTDEQLIELYKKLSDELGKAASQAEVTNYRKTNKKYPSAIVLQRRIGFHKLAEACGYSSNKHKIYTEEELLHILKNYYLQYGTPTQDDFDNNPDLPSSTTYIKYFGGIRKALIHMNLIEEKRNYSIYQNMNDDDIFELVKNYYNIHGSIQTKDFRKENNLPTGTYLRKRFGSLKTVYEQCGIPYDDKYFSEFKNISDDDMLIKLKWFYEKYGLPMNRDVDKCKEMPSSFLYYTRFGNFKNAIKLAGIDIPQDKMWLYERESMTNEEILNALRECTEEKLSKSGLSLLTLREIDENEKLPSDSVVLSRFGSIENIYYQIGYDYYQFNKELIEKDMLERYIDIYNVLGRIPTSRDIEHFSRSRENYYAMKTYETHFGSLSNLQKLCGFIPTGATRLKSKDDLITDLQRLSIELDRTPVMMDLFNYSNIASPSKYLKEFGGFSEALIAAGLTPNVGVYYTPNGTKCLSYYELRITEWLEKNKVYYEKEVPYRDVLQDDESLRRFDWIVNHNENIYYIEMFGIIGIDGYKEKSERKIKDCKRNGINLICIYPDDFKRPLEEVFSFLLKVDKERSNYIA